MMQKLIVPLMLAVAISNGDELSKFCSEVKSGNGTRINFEVSRIIRQGSEQMSQVIIKKNNYYWHNDSCFADNERATLVRNGKRFLCITKLQMSLAFFSDSLRYPYTTKGDPGYDLMNILQYINNDTAKTIERRKRSKEVSFRANADINKGGEDTLIVTFKKSELISVRIKTRTSVSGASGEDSIAISGVQHKVKMADNLFDIDHLLLDSANRYNITGTSRLLNGLYDVMRGLQQKQ